MQGVYNDLTSPTLEEMRNYSEFEQSLLTMAEQTRSRQNYIVSPVSLRVALLLAIEGAEGGTKAALLKAAGFESEIQADNWYRYVKANVDSFAMNKKYLGERIQKGFFEKDPSKDMQFRIVNSVWNNSDLHGDFTRAYKSHIREKYGAQAKSVSGEKLQKEVNRWVSKETDGFIPKIVDDSTNTAAILANALYLRTSWVKEFKKANTKKDDFTTADGKTVQKDFLCKKEKMLYAEKDDENKLVALQLRGDILLVAVLGDMGDTSDIRLAVGNANELMVNLKLPKIDVESSYDKDILALLKERGGELPFTDDADFSAMVENDRWKIGDVIQKARMKTDESGLEAAAVTVIQMFRGAALRPTTPDTVKEFIADRPFKFYVMTNNFRSLLFAGAINK